MNAPCPSRRGFSAGLLLVLLVAVAIGLILLFGGFGGKSHVQQAVQTKKQGESVSIGVQAQQLAILVAEYRMNHDGKAPANYQDLGVQSSSFLDPWGRPLRFRMDGPPREARSLIVISDGPDGQPDSEDDVSAAVPLQF